MRQTPKKCMLKALHLHCHDGTQAFPQELISFKFWFSLGQPQCKLFLHQQLNDEVPKSTWHYYIACQICWYYQCIQLVVIEPTNPVMSKTGVLLYNRAPPPQKYNPMQHFFHFTVFIFRLCNIMLKKVRHTRFGRPSPFHF